MNTRKTKIGLVLSGGGARGIAHLGAVKALQEAGLKPDFIAGTSAGSIVGMMIAAGHSPEMILEIIENIVVFKYLKPAFNRLGLFKIDKLEELFLTYIPHNSFEKLLIPLTVTATDIENGKLIYFNSGELIKPILASCAIPGVFQPVSFQGKTFVDGGVMSNLPTEAIAQKSDFLIAVNVSPIRLQETKSMKDVLIKSLYLAINQTSSTKFAQCQLVIDPPELSNFEGFEIKKARKMFDIGYEATIKELEKHKSEISLIL